MNGEFELTGTDGIRKPYKITERRIMDSRRAAIPLESNGHDVLFITCFPFDAIQAGGPLRFVVRAEPVS